MKQTLILLKLIRKPYVTLTSNHKEKDNARNIQKTNSNWNRNTTTKIKTIQHLMTYFLMYSTVYVFKLKCTVILHLKTGSLGYETIR